jgi:ABC-2 type transport system permease protein
VELIVRRIRFLVWKELIELRQDPRLFFIVVAAPVLQLVLLGYAATTDVRNVPVAIADADRSDASRELIARFDASPTFTIAAVVSSPDELGRFLESGEAWLALAIPPEYGSFVSGGRPQRVQLLADGSDSNSAGLSLGYATNLLASYGEELAARRRDAPADAGGIEPIVRVWFNPRLESRDFMIPGVVALLLLVITTNLSSMGIVREKELGTLEQLNVTPLGRAELIVGKLLPYALIGLIDVVLVLVVALWWFEVPMRGSVVQLFAMSVIYLLSTLGLGLFVSTISATQQQAMMTSIFFFLTPMIYLSGFVFPIENMPTAIQPLTYLIPLRYFLVILRSIFLKGVGLEVFWPQALALAAWGVAMLGLAVARSSKRLA